MKVLNCLAVLTLLFNGASASANWRDDNPNKPNGYEASMLRYHYGTPDDSEPHNGYRATEIRARNGLDIYAPPSDDDSWGDHDRSGSSSRFAGGGGGRSNGLLGSHFRQGQAEGEAYWKQRLQNRMPPSNMSMGGGISGIAGQRQMDSYQQQMPAYRQQMQACQAHSWQGNRAGTSAQYAGHMGGASAGCQSSNPFAAGYNQSAVNGSANYQYSPNTPYGVNPSALRSVMGQRPMATLLRNSQGGFNRIYMGE